MSEQSQLNQMSREVGRLEAALKVSNGEVEKLRAWVTDLQSGMFINCVYCGHQYGPTTKAPMQETLHKHIAVCPKHPLSAALAEVERLKAELVIVENGAAACGRFVIAHKDLALEEDPVGYLLSHAHGVATREGGCTSWLSDMVNGSIKARTSARAEGMEEAAAIARATLESHCDDAAFPIKKDPPCGNCPACRLADWVDSDIAAAKQPTGGAGSACTCLAIGGGGAGSDNYDNCPVHGLTGEAGSREEPSPVNAAESSGSASPNYEPKGVEFFDCASSRTMLLVADDESRKEIRGWVLYRHPDGQWVTLRKATDEDLDRINTERRRLSGSASPVDAKEQT